MPTLSLPPQSYKLSEKDFYVHALHFMRENGGSITTSELREKLYDVFRVEGDNSIPIKGRSAGALAGTKAAQQMRNIVSNGFLIDNKYITHDVSIETSTITQKGIDLLDSLDWQ